MPEPQENTSLTEHERSHIQNTFRIPVDSTWPGTSWIVCLDSESETPTDDELRQIQSYLEFIVRRTYRESFADQLLKMPLAKCSGHNTVILRKGWEHKGAWSYRASSWEFGPRYVPYRSRPHSLPEVLDQREKLILEPWETWKRAHPEVFPPHQASRP